MELLQRKENLSHNELNQGNDLYLTKRAKIEIKADAVAVWRDMILYDKLTLESQDSTNTKRAQVNARYIYILGGKLKLQNIDLTACYIFRMTFKQFSQAVQKICREPFPQQVPFLRDQVVPQSPFASNTCTLGPDLDAKSAKGLTTLMIASYCGDEQVVRFLLAAKADVQISTEDGWTALRFGTVKNSPPVVELLIQAKAKLDVIDGFGKTVLHTAAAKNYPEVAKLLIEARANPLTQAGLNDTPFSSAVDSGAVEILNLLVAEGGVELTEYVHTDISRLSPQLMHAIANGHLEKLKELQAKGFSIEATNSVRQTPLIIAAQYGHVKILDLLISMGANIEAKSIEGTSLTWAARNGHLAAVEYLIGRKAKISREPEGPLVWAIRKGHTSIIRQLVIADLEGAIDLLSNAAKSGQLLIAKSLLAANVAYDATDSHGYSPFGQALAHAQKQIITLFIQQEAAGAEALPWALEQGFLVSAEHLVDLGVKLDSQNSSGMTALMLAATLHGSEQLIKNLLDGGAQHNIKDKKKRSAFTYAVIYGREQMIFGLMALEAAIDEKDYKGRTPLTYAALQGHDKIASWLIAGKADPNTIDSEGRTPIEHAAINGYKTIVCLLASKVDLNRRDSENRNLIMLAGIHGHLAIVHFLLEQNVDLTPNHDNLTPFMHVQMAYGETFGTEGGQSVTKSSLGHIRHGYEIGLRIDPENYIKIMDLLISKKVDTIPHALNLKQNSKKTTRVHFAKNVTGFLYTDTDPEAAHFAETVTRFEYPLPDPDSDEEEKN
jgi:ankyrin repeat protein